jgi:glucose-1-phosphate adenylyltransferase
MKTHRETRADVTIAVLPVKTEACAGLGICKVDDKGRVTEFIEKPQTPEQLKPFHTSTELIKARGVEAKGRNYLASMGIYLFKRETLIQLLNAPPLATDFGKEIFPRSLHTHHTQAYLFDGYWEDVGTVKSYHEANLALCEPNPPFELNAAQGVIYTRMRYLPASRIDSAKLDRALVSDGCVIGEGTTITRSVIGVRMQIGKNSKITNSVVIGIDHYETPAEKSANARRGVPNLGIGDNCVVENAILDKDAAVGNNAKIVNAGRVKEGEGKNFVIRDGLVVIPRGAVIEEGTVI